jgi:hypothetical protein
MPHSACENRGSSGKGTTSAWLRMFISERGRDEDSKTGGSEEFGSRHSGRHINSGLDLLMLMLMLMLMD